MAATARKTLTPAQLDAKRAARAEQIATMQTTLEQAVTDLATSEAWTRWLDHLASFHRYSFNNSFLILAQCPHATHVAGFRAWQAKGRQVRKGEKGIRIFGKPFRTVTTTDETTGETTRSTYRTAPPVATVFDISQTDPIDGADTPDSPARPLTGTAPAHLWDRMADHITATGWTITRQAIPGQANGYCTTDGTHQIVVDADISDAQATKTLIHEIAHALMHTDDTGHRLTDIARETAELEAESVAYVVAGIAGLDTSDYSLGYLVGWAGGDPDAIKTTAVRVHDTAHTLAALLETDQD